VTAVLTRPDHRAAAERLQSEIAALPGFGHGADLLEQLGALRRPVVR
jgi:hypothetical protein